jgi:hypothetical protein
VRRYGPNTRSQSATHPHSPPRPRGEAADNEREGLPRQLDIDFGWSSLIVDAAIQADNLTLDLATIRYLHAVLLAPSRIGSAWSLLVAARPFLMLPVFRPALM